MPTEKQSSTFISYSRINQEFALKLAKELRAAGFSVWLDQLDIPTGARWDDEIEEALRECGIFLAIVTPAFAASENAKDEIGYAIDHGKRILPVLLEDCEIPLRLRRFQYVDFTRMKYREGVHQARELLAKLVKEKSIPAVPHLPKDPTGEKTTPTKKRERPGQPARSRPKSGRAAPRSVVPAAPRGTPAIKPTVVIAGVAGLIILFLTGGMLWGRGMFPFAQPSPTTTPTHPDPATSTMAPTEIPATRTPTPAFSRFFTEEFDRPDPWDRNWSQELMHGDLDKATFSIADGQADWLLDDEYLWDYYLYQPYTYADVQIDVEFKNLTGPARSYLSLICRYNDAGWYEFSIYGGQYEIIRRGVARERVSGRSGGLSGYRFGNDVVNRVTAICRGDEISIFANDGNPHPFKLGSNENLGEGQVGIALISDQNWPVSIQITSIRISQP